MAIRERLVYAIDFVTDTAQKGLKGFRQDIAQAEGATNKFKAGASSAMATVGANAASLAVAGGTALAVFGAKAVQAFQETALEAGKFADATALSTEEASRWVEVAGDVGVSADVIQGAFLRMNKAIGDGGPVVEQYGLELKRTADGAADVNGTMLDAIERIGGIVNPTERAAAAQAVFGRSYAEAAEIIFSNADQVKASLDAVSDAKVITDEELEKAREFRDTMDELKENSEGLAISIGQALVPVLADAAKAANDLRDLIGQARGQIEKVPGGEGVWDALTTNLFELPRKSKEEWDDLGRKIGVLPDKVDRAASSFDGAKDKIQGAAEATEEEADALEAVEEALASGDPAWDSYIANQESALASAEGAPGTFEDMERAVEGVNEAAQNAADEGLAAFQQAITDAQDAITGKFDEFRDSLDMQDLLADIAEQVDAVNKAAEELGEGGEQEARNYRGEVRRLQGQVVDLLETYDDLPPQKITEILTRISQGDVNEILRVIDELTKDRFIKVGVIVPDVNNAYDSINTRIGNGTSPSPIFNNPNPAPSIGTPAGGGVSAQSITINTLTSSPARQYVDRQIDDRRNGVR